jgi:hypothetical protein
MEGHACHNYQNFMIKDENAAKQVSDSMFEILRQVQDSMAAVQETCSHEEYVAYSEAAGKVVAPIIFEVLEPLYSDHPALKPSDWD